VFGRLAGPRPHEAIDDEAEIKQLGQ
jgi:hypothetical protein